MNSRRRFVKVSTAALGAALLPAGRVWASESPEVSAMKFGMIALTDCSPIVIAHEKGLFKKYGINSTVSKGASWAAIRDSLSNGDIQATHMLIGMPIASTMGLLGSPKKPMVIPWLLNRNGQAITLEGGARRARSQADPKALKPLVDAAKAAGDAADLRDDVPARHARDVDALLPRRRRHQSRQGRRAHHHPAARRWSPT